MSYVDEFSVQVFPVMHDREKVVWSGSRVHVIFVLVKVFLLAIRHIFFMQCDVLVPIAPEKNKVDCCKNSKSLNGRVRIEGPLLHPPIVA